MPIQKKKKRTLIIILSIILTGLIFRGPLYRVVIKYQPIAERPNYTITNPELIEICKIKGTPEKNSSIKDIIRSSHVITSDLLEFSFTQAETDPNKLVNTHKANCVGYAALFAAVCNHQFVTLKRAPDWTATPYKGQLYLFGVNIHPYIQSPFFKDHDFVIIRNKNTGETYAADPSIRDYLRINYITLKSNRRHD